MSNGYYVGVPIPSVIYVGCPDRSEFDKIGAETVDHGLDDNGNHVLTKSISGPGDTPGRPVKVIFQHWLAQETMDHMIERHKRERAAQPMRAADGATEVWAPCSGCMRNNCRIQRKCLDAG